MTYFAELGAGKGNRFRDLLQDVSPIVRDRETVGKPIEVECQILPAMSITK
jgi:hypothetical protein